MLVLAADITGTWTFHVETPAGAGTPTFVLKQDGEKLTGKYAGLFGEAPVSGTVQGDKIEIVIEVAPEGGDKVKITYSGTVESAKSMKGKVTFPNIAEGTWTATRK